MKSFYWYATVFLTAALVAAGTMRAGAVEPGGPDRLIDREYVTLIALRDALGDGARSRFSLSSKQLETLGNYYKASDARLIWIKEDGLDTQALSSLKKVFQRADIFGLNSDDYSVVDGQALASANDTPEKLAEAEIRISLKALDYANDAQAGRVHPSSINRKYLDLKPQKPDGQLVLAGLAKTKADLSGHLESYHPSHEQFKALKEKLAETRKAQSTGSVPVRIPDGPALGPDTYHPQIAVVRKRLSVPSSPNAPRGNAEEYYDAALADAVREFQASRGLRTDGIIGRNTRNALNEGTIPVSVNTIIANMERWRWMPRDLGKRHVFVNIPEFIFRVISDGRVIHRERIVTGSTKNPTPIFSDKMETVVFNPYWNVPRSILVNEILPVTRNDPDYIYRNNLEIIWQGQRTVDPYMVDWFYVNPDKLRLRQRPGRGNALGVVKFLFPNKHAVYMHDTPSKHLFNKPVRAYSHGCMRVRNPLDFAKLLLKEQGWTDDRIQRALARGENQHVALKNKLPVHVAYFTAWVDEDGELKGFRDVYSHDAGVRVALHLDTPRILAASEEEFEAEERGLRN